jgi:hypothetical protein
VARCGCPESSCKADREIAHRMSLPSASIANWTRFPSHRGCEASAFSP